MILVLYLYTSRNKAKNIFLFNFLIFNSTLSMIKEVMRRIIIHDSREATAAKFFLHVLLVQYFITREQRYRQAASLDKKVKRARLVQKKKLFKRRNFMSFEDF